MRKTDKSRKNDLFCMLLFNMVANELTKKIDEIPTKIEFLQQNQLLKRCVVNFGFPNFENYNFN